MGLLTVINSKLLLLILLILGVLGLVATFSKKSVRTEIYIPAEPNVIWEVLMATSEYQHWNPVLIPESGNIQHGAKIRYQWNQPGGQTIEIESKVLELVENRLLHQRGGTPGILTFDHRYQIHPDNSGSRVIQSEEYRGIGVWFWNAQQMEPEYKKVNEALKTRVEESFKRSTVIP